MLWIDFDLTQTFPEEGALTSRQQMWVDKEMKLVDYFVNNLPEDYKEGFFGHEGCFTCLSSGELFHIQAFKLLNIKRPEDLYNLRVLNGLNQQELPLWDDLADQFVFCSAVREGYGVRIAHEIRLTTVSVQAQMRKGSKITGFPWVAKPYVARDAAAKNFNESSDVSDSLQNLMLQHTSIDMFLKHYLDRNINADVLSIYRGLEPQKALMRMMRSMRRSIDPRRLWKLTLEQSKSVPAKHHEDLSESRTLEEVL
ncbi:hypothetical protein AJ78_01677 [Emergomyces pasteurianus Ep9510]|uniref:Uncharacterized protein n=1 Tax=Emergomyces pasteurianus Ep9510 TaxID=1447872 RepID=A0A1J9QSQ2_9EURO|nr:hypothetical protein AJ78_01677 [Emergomyces pasteurianus Ep9510]